MASGAETAPLANRNSKFRLRLRLSELFLNIHYKKKSCFESVAGMLLDPICFHANHFSNIIDFYNLSIYRLRETASYRKRYLDQTFPDQYNRSMDPDFPVSYW